MATNNLQYKGLECYLCKDWFSKMYLFKQHSRKKHSTLGDYIDFPALPGVLSQGNDVQFAILHVKRDLRLLMRVYTGEKQCTMRLANRYDFNENKEQQTEGEDGLTIKVVFDVYPILSDGEITGFSVIPWAKLTDELQNSYTKAIVTDEYRQRHVHADLPMISVADNLHLDWMDDENWFLEYIPNIFAASLEEIVNTL